MLNLIAALVLLLKGIGSLDCTQDSRSYRDLSSSFSTIMVNNFKYFSIF